MARWQPEKLDTLRELAGEITHNYPRGAILVAVDGGDPAATAAFADDLADVLRETRQDVERSGIDRARTSGTSALVVADGPFLTREDLAGIWHFLVWVDEPGLASASRAASRSVANALINNGDPEHPRRVFADSC